MLLKTIYNIFKKLKSKGIIIFEEESRRKFNLTKNILQNIENILSDNNGLEVNEIKGGLEKQRVEIITTLTSYSN